MILFKKRILLLIITLFIFNILTQFSENLLSELLVIRNHYYVENNQEIVIIKLSLSKWISQEDKKEIIFKKKYFDIKNAIVTDNQVTLFAVEDSYERILKFVQKSLAKKLKKETEKNRTKIKRIIDLYYAMDFENKIDLNFNLKYNPTKYTPSFFNSNVIKPTIKPPII